MCRSAWLLLIILCSCSQVSFKPSHTTSLALAWRHNLGYGTRLQLRHQYPIYYENALYLCDRNRLIALNATSGKRLWRERFPTTLNSCLGRFADILYFTDDDGSVYAFNLLTREILWQVSLGESSIVAPVANEQVVLILTLSEHLYALNAQDGSELWSYQSYKPPLTLFGSFRPLIIGPYAFTGFADGALTVHDWQNGRLISYRQIAIPRGKTDLERLIDLDASAIFDNGILYLSSYSGFILALDLQGNSEQWRADYGSLLPLSHDEDTIYGVDKDNQLYAIAKDDGATLWQQNNLTDRQLTAPVLWQDNIALGDDSGHIYLFSAQDGSLVAKKRLGITSFNPILSVAEDKLILLDTEGFVTSLESRQ